MLFSVSTYVEYLLPPLICIYSCLHFCLYLLDVVVNYLIFTLQILFTGKPLYEMLFSVSTYVEYLLPPLICIYSCLHFCLYLLDVVVNYLIFVLQILFKGKPLYEMLFSVSTCRLQSTFCHICICIYSCLYFCLYLLDVVVNCLISMLQILFTG